MDSYSSRKPYPKGKQCNGLCHQACTNFSLGAKEKAKKYFSRFYKFRQMDFEYASWQMVNIFVAPQKLYRNFSYHHFTRNQWARDDPAFMILLIPWIFLSTSTYSILLNHSFFGWLKHLFWSIVFECIFSGLIVASFMWIISNRWMIRGEHLGIVSSGSTSPTIFGGPNRGTLNYMRHSSVASDDESINSDGSSSYPPVVEWAYAFDIHLNAFFSCFIFIHIIQLIFFYFTSGVTFVSVLIANTFWLVGILYYVYITFLGYKALPFLRRTRSILLTGTVIVVLYVVSLALHWNLTIRICSFYRMF
nr:protein unc 50 [Hymenolepis microstoma]